MTKYKIYLSLEDDKKLINQYQLLEAVEALKKLIKENNAEQILLFLRDNPILFCTDNEIIYNPAIQYAAQQNYPKVARLLLLVKPSLANSSTDTSSLPLIVAAGKGCLKITELLIKALADKSDAFFATDLQGRNALHSATEGGHKEVVELILKAQPAMLYTVDSEGRNALHLAAKNGHKEIAELLLTIDPLLVNSVDNDGNTALHLAAWSGRDSEEMQALFLKINPKIASAANKYGDTASVYAYRIENPEDLSISGGEESEALAEPNPETSLSGNSWCAVS